MVLIGSQEEPWQCWATPFPLFVESFEAIRKQLMDSMISICDKNNHCKLLAVGILILCYKLIIIVSEKKRHWRLFTLGLCLATYLFSEVHQETNWPLNG
ncbi:hypothetical protein BCR42DRAFT_173751 [Absidia repens]|uniref:Uncharacterized protein n=1 Tax=Absidia repens TaxID=90262 RepID=A0A1X2HZT4_9FUNG|nr:hypothetical protein BCR42DRAFT_173751 [Absidia repens]